MPDVEIQWNGSSIRGYLAVPESGSGQGTIVLQEWWGLDATIERYCDRAAEAGFVALAPDLYGKQTTTEPDEAQRKMMSLEMDETARQLDSAVDFLADHGASDGDAVGSFGFCLGGGLSIWAASVNPRVKAAVAYYSVFPHGKPDFSRIDAPVLGHFGTADDFVSADDARALEAELKAAGIDATFEYYEGQGHAFANDHDRLGTYDAAADALAWERTITFLKAQLA